MNLLISVNKLPKKLEQEGDAPASKTHKLHYEKGVTPAQLVQETPLIINYFAVAEEAVADDEEEEMTEKEFHQRLKEM